MVRVDGCRQDLDFTDLELCGSCNFRGTIQLHLFMLSSNTTCVRVCVCVFCGLGLWASLAHGLGCCDTGGCRVGKCQAVVSIQTIVDYQFPEVQEAFLLLHASVLPNNGGDHTSNLVFYNCITVHQVRALGQKCRNHR